MNAIVEKTCTVTAACGSKPGRDTAPVSDAPVVHDLPAPAPPGPPHSESRDGSECGALQWFVLRHRPMEGRQAATRIRALGFQVHHFREEVSRRSYEDTLRAYFPGYLFVRFALGDPHWGGIMRVSPVTGILCSTFGQPVSVPDAAMALVQSKFDDRDIYVPETPPPPSSRVGRMFSVQVGPWAQFMGQCVSEDPKGRVRLLLTLFGRSSVQSFRPEQVREVG